MHRVHCHHSMWRMRLQWRELELKSLKDHAQRYLGLKQREVLADADAWPPAEREKRARVLGRLGDPLGEPVRLELVRVASPDLGVVVDEQHGELQDHAGRVRGVPDHHLLVRLPAERDGRRVQPEDLVKNHGHLRQHNGQGKD